jgi:hypothetical protein
MRERSDTDCTRDEVKRLHDIIRNIIDICMRRDTYGTIALFPDQSHSRAPEDNT